MSELIPLAIRLTIDLAALFVIVKLVYQRIDPRRDYALTYVLFNLITFFLCYHLNRVPIELGFALGLFAIFGILRYRTEAIRLRDLTYLFVVIGLGIINAVGGEQIALHEAITVDVVIALAIVILERPMSDKRVEEKLMTYDRLDLLAPGHEHELHMDIETRTGFTVRRVSIENIDLVRQVATITVHWVRERKKPA
jgi:hypothetical protein